MGGRKAAKQNDEAEDEKKITLKHEAPRDGKLLWDRAMPYHLALQAGRLSWHTSKGVPSGSRTEVWFGAHTGVPLGELWLSPVILAL